jgi:23S rRNA-/tRNA-specific pseudouridylate synthase
VLLRWVVVVFCVTLLLLLVNRGAVDCYCSRSSFFALRQSRFMNRGPRVIGRAILGVSNNLKKMEPIVSGVTQASAQTVPSSSSSAAVQGSSSQVVRHHTITQKDNQVISFDILYEDEHLIAVNKPANILSCPGVRSRNVFYEPKVVPISPGSATLKMNPKFVPRNDKFMTAVANAAQSAKEEGDNEHYDILNHLHTSKINCGLPRKKRSFIDFLSKRPYSVDNPQLRLDLWDRVAKADFQLLSKEKDMSADDYEHCMTDILEAVDNKRVFQVHRLDMETSGVMYFARTDVACADLMKQLREKEANKQYIAKVIGRLSESVTEIDIPIRPDTDNRPYQVSVPLMSV